MNKKTLKFLKILIRQTILLLILILVSCGIDTNSDENSLLFSQDLENRPYQDQDAINLLCDEGVTLHTSTNITKLILTCCSSRVY